ncbi:hypothetical protein D3C81_1871060 [compost metagenome]
MLLLQTIHPDKFIKADDSHKQYQSQKPVPAQRQHRNKNAPGKHAGDYPLFQADSSIGSNAAITP